MAFFEDYFHTETILMEVRVYKIQSGKKRIILTQKKKHKVENLTDVWMLVIG